MPAPAPWRPLLSSHLSSLIPPIITLSTLSATTPPLPRARTVVFRGFLASLPHNSRNPAPLNPPIYTSDIITITTDVRMAKGAEFGGDGGPGGPFEGVIWVPGEMTQWRVRGRRGYLLGRDADGDEPGVKATRQVLTGHLRRIDGEDDDEKLDGRWSFAREVTAHFGNLSSGMRGSFRNAAPGLPISVKPGEGEGLGQTVDDVEDAVARRNFRVVALVVEEVDQVDLRDSKRARRWVYRLDGGGEWQKDEVWP